MAGLVLLGEAHVQQVNGLAGLVDGAEVVTRAATDSLVRGERIGGLADSGGPAGRDGPGHFLPRTGGDVAAGQEPAHDAVLQGVDVGEAVVVQQLRSEDAAGPARATHHQRRVLRQRQPRRVHQEIASRNVVRLRHVAAQVLLPRPHVHDHHVLAAPAPAGQLYRAQVGDVAAVGDAFAVFLSVHAPARAHRQALPLPLVEAASEDADVGVAHTCQRLRRHSATAPVIAAQHDGNAPVRHHHRQPDLQSAAVDRAGAGDLRPRELAAFAHVDAGVGVSEANRAWAAEGRWMGYSKPSPSSRGYSPHLVWTKHGFPDRPSCTRWGPTMREGSWRQSYGAGDSPPSYGHGRV